MACFICNQYGHWSRDCPSSVCTYCGMHGHTVNSCGLKDQYKPAISPPQPEQISRTRTRKSSKTLDDILYENHIVVSNTMKNDVDEYIKQHFLKRGMIDDCLVAETIFNDELIFNIADNGHMNVLGYILGKYCDVSNTIVKEFLRGVYTEVNDCKFRNMMNRYGITPYSKNGLIHFRKLSGFTV